MTTLRAGAPDDVEPCVALWEEAVAVRDGRRFPLVPVRAREKFDRRLLHLVAEDDGALLGFALVTEAGSGRADDPAEAAVLGMLGIAPTAQGKGVGGLLLDTATEEARRLGPPALVLHVLADNAAALRLYEGRGWEQHGEPHEHELLHRPHLTLVKRL